MNKLKFMTDKGLAYFNDNFETEFLPLYKSNSIEELKVFFENQDNVVETDEVLFEYYPLQVEGEYDSTIAKHNVKLLWGSLHRLAPHHAELEKVWIALANTYYLEFMINSYFSLQGKVNENIEARYRFKHGAKRSLVTHNLSLLWWIAYYLYDENCENNPWHLVDFFLDTPYRGNSVAFFSSNLLSNRKISRGIVAGIRELVNQKVIIVNRYAYSNSNKILNELGGVRIIDMLSEEEIKSIIVENLSKSRNIKLLNN